jgi:hypothetical protein
MKSKNSKSELEWIKSMVFDLRHEMIMRKYSIEILKTWLNDKLELFKDPDKKLMLLLEVEKIRKFHDYSVYYADETKPFFLHVEDLIRFYYGQIDTEIVFDKENLKEIILKDNIDIFYEYKKSLISLGYFDKNRKWQKTKKVLIALIFEL